MKGSKKLKPVAQVAEQRERNAARELGDSQRQLNQQQKQLDDLLAYRTSYEENYLAATRNGLSAAQMRDYQIFLSRLDSAITQQQQVVEGGSQDRDISQANWAGAAGHNKMINKIVESRQDNERQQQDKKEQRDSDDRSQNNHLSR